MPVFKPAFNALLKEASFTKEMLAAGATQIRCANYASKGIYFQSFVSLATGLERIGKLCLILDHYIQTGGSFPNFDYMKKDIGHKLTLLYEKSQGIISERSIVLRYHQALSDPIQQSMLDILHSFSEGDRYTNINYLVGSVQTDDPIARWHQEVDLPLFEKRVSTRRKEAIARNAKMLAEAAKSWSTVLHIDETDNEITDFKNASKRTGIFEAVAPYRQLYVLQIIRYWIELLGKLEGPARGLDKQEIPFFGEIFGLFYNDDSFFRSRKTW